MREKLIELLHSGVRCPGTVTNCGDCPYRSDKVPCDEYGATADMLIANGVTIQKWIPVTERLPSDRGDVLVVAWWHEKWQAMTGWYAVTSNIWHILTADGFLPWEHITHWMPLPEPPKGE